MEKRIGFGRRLGAYLIDIVFIVGLGYILISLTGDLLEQFVDFSKMNDEQINALSSQPIMWTLSVLLPIAIVFVSFIYNLLEGFTGFTLGKLMLGIQIGNQDGTPTEISKLMARYALKNISSIVGLIGLAAMISIINTIGSALGFVVTIGCFFALGEKKLALHDMLAKTAVYRKSELADGSAAKPLFADNE